MEFNSGFKGLTVVSWPYDVNAVLSHHPCG